MIRSPLFWLSLLLSLVSYIFHTFLGAKISGTGLAWYLDAGDTYEYFCYGDSLLHGHYNCDGTLFNRMPFYPALYAFLRIALDPVVTRVVMVLIQVFAGGMAIFMLAEIASKRLFTQIKPWIMVVFFSSIWLLRSWDNYLLTESLATSTFTAGIYFGMFRQTSRINLVISGICFTLCIFLRPFAILLMICFGVYLLFDLLKQKNKLRNVVSTLLIWLLPFAVLESAWIARNFHAAGRFVPLQEGNRYPGLEASASTTQATAMLSYNEIWAWIRAVGEDALFWNPGSLGCWMYGGPYEPESYNYKSHLVAQTYGVAEIERLRSLYRQQQSVSDPLIRDSLERELVTLGEKMIAAYKTERPFQYHVMAPLRILHRAFVHAGPLLPVYSWPEVKNHPMMLGLKLYSILTYWILLCFGFLGMLFYFRKNRDFLVITSMVLALVVFMGPFLRYAEFRLYFLIFPLLTMLSAHFLGEMMRKLSVFTGLKWVGIVLKNTSTNPIA